MADRYLSYPSNQAQTVLRLDGILPAKRLESTPSGPGDTLPLDSAPPTQPYPEVDDGVDVEVVVEAKTKQNAATREQRRSRRQRAVRARTISTKRMTKRELELGRLLYPEDDYERPKTRADCANGPRPCPFVSCQFSLYLDVSPQTGAIKLNYPDLEPDGMKESCALDIADRGGTTLEEVGAIMNLTRERIRQLEVKAMAKLEAVAETASLRDFVDGGPAGKRRLPMLRVVRDEPEDDDEPGPVGDFLGEFESDDGDRVLGFGGEAFTRTQGLHVPRMPEARRLAFRLVSFTASEFGKLFGDRASVYLTRLVRDGGLERTDRGRYVTTAKLDEEMSGR